MKIIYDKTSNIAGIGLVPWTRLGLERWFETYRIASLYDWDVHDMPGAPVVKAIAKDGQHAPTMPKLNTQSLIETPQFAAMAETDFQGYTFLTYKPVTPPDALLAAGHTFLAGNITLNNTLENKAEFRLRFADLGLPFPGYTIVKRAGLQADAATLHQLLRGNDEVVVQDECLSGGRGTFMIRNVQDLAHALTSIERLGGGQRLVVSERIRPAFERSVQCCATRYGVFVGPLQKQIIADPLLANVDVADGDRFCGAEISPNDPFVGAYPEIRTYAETIGKRLLELGYRGIFSVDCLVTPEGQVYVLEINPRLTGITPLVTMMYREGKDIPFYLLHILELANLDYEITDFSVDVERPAASLLVVHSTRTAPTRIRSSLTSGLYDLRTLDYLKKQYRIDMTDTTKRQILLQQYTPPGFTIKPGGRLLTAYVNGPVLESNDTLLPDAQDAVRAIHKHVILEELQP